MSNISAVQVPIPRTRPSRSMISSSDRRRITASEGTVPSRVLAARSRSERSFDRERPAARSISSGAASSCSGCGCRSPNPASKRPRIALAALACSCWYRMDSSSASKGECVLFTRSAKGPTRAIRAPSLGVSVGQLFECKRCVVTNRAQAVVHENILITEPRVRRRSR